jgi:thiamine pyrophosphokinase
VNERIVIVAGSRPIEAHVVARIPASAIILAVDGGIDHARAAGLQPSGLIGDLDSVSPEGLSWAKEHVTIARHPTDKDRTDTELALAFAADMDPARLTMVGGGDRLDHTIGALGALGATVLTSIPRIDAWWDGQHVDVVHGPGRAVLELVAGSTLSLLALHGGCGRVSIDGVRWPLDEADVLPVSGFGISNEVTIGDTPFGDVAISLSSGVLTVFDHPAPEEADAT